MRRNPTANFLCLLVLTGCSPQAANRPSPSPSKLASEIEKEASDQMGGTLTPQQRDDLKNGTGPQAPPMDISGIAFAPGPLPESIVGKQFYSTQTFGGSVEIRTSSEAVLRPYHKPEINCTYLNKTEGEAPRLILSFREEGADQTVTYNVTRGEKFAMLHCAEVRDGWPVVMKGIVD